MLSENIHGQKAEFFVRPNTNDRQILSEVGSYHLADIDFKTSDIVIDIGGHIGSFAIGCALGGVSVISFEPEPENYQMFEANIKLNKLEKNIILHNKGISINGKDAYLYIDEINPGSHSMIKGCVDHKGSKKIVVETVTLDTITKDLPSVKVLKLDCEGLEYDILMWSDLSKVERIVAELHDRDKLPDLMKYLMTKGFFVKWHYGKRLGLLRAKR